MKLLNYTTFYISAILLIIISVWAGLFYYAMLDEIYDSIDDGLDNQKLLIIQKASSDTSVLFKDTLGESGYYITQSDSSKAVLQEKYIDTVLYMENEKDFEPVRMLITGFKKENNYYTLTVATSMVEEDDLITELLYAILLLYVCMIIAIIVLNNIILKKIWAPFYKLLNSLKRFRLDHQKPIRPAKTNVDEFHILNKTVEEMLQSNIDAYNSQKSFIENAAHELQTPLAISINKLEAFTESSDLTEEQLQLVGSAITNLARLTRLNKSLLLLSRIDNHQFPNRENINLKEVVKDITEEFSDQFDYYGISHILETADVCNVNMDSELAHIMVLNLVKNAIVHNHKDGFVNIQLKTDSLTVINSGGKALDPDLIFKRFYKADPSGKSTGLGLSIVRSVCDLYGFKISYDFNKKHIIKIYFKGPFS